MLGKKKTEEEVLSGKLSFSVKKDAKFRRRQRCAAWESDLTSELVLNGWPVAGWLRDVKSGFCSE